MPKKLKKKAVKKPAKKAAKKTAKKKIAKKASKPVKKASKKLAAKPVTPKTNVVNPYLTFNGNCEDAFSLYKSVFGGNYTYVGRFKDMPAEGGTPMPPEQAEKIMHISLPISPETALMGSDSSPEYGQATNIGNNFSISINATTQSEADRLYNGLAQGGMAVMPMNKTFWGSYFGLLTDKFGIQWMISFDDRSITK